MSEQPSPEIDPSIAEYYHQAPEKHRLEQGRFLLEELRTRELIERHARRPPATVLDVGAAAGAYALWLADAGYAVHLVDPVPRLVAEHSAAAPRAPGRLPRAESVTLGPWTSRRGARTWSSSWARSIT